MLFTGDGDGDGVFAKKIAVHGWAVDELAMGADEVGGQEDVVAESRKEVVEVWGGGWGEGGEGT